MNRYQQWEGLMLLGREHQLDIDHDDLRGVYWIGAKRYYNVIDASIALLVAFKKVGIPIPEALNQRPIDLE